MKGGLMVCGTSSDAGKSHVVTGLCRLLVRSGVRVAPFKAQNMSLNSYVTPSGHEIGRAQGVQALASRVEPEVAMNPILLKPTGERSSQVVVMGKPVAHMDALSYHHAKEGLLDVVTAALEELRGRFDVVICEGAGSPAEINLGERDVVNLRLAARAGLPAVVVGDIDRGGVFAALYGTVALQPDRHRHLIKGFIINKLRGDPALLGDGPAELERRCGVPTLGVLPWVHGLGLDAEDSLAISATAPEPAGLPVAPPPRTALSDRLDVAALRLPRIANFTDLDALSLEPGVDVRLVDRPGALGDPDLIVVPGSKATVSDLEWLRGLGFHHRLAEASGRGATVLGLCAGYQMLGRRIIDGVESGRGEVEGLGWLDVTTTFLAEKVTRQRRGDAAGERVTGYEIHHGRPERGEVAERWLHLDDAYGEEWEGCTSRDRRVLATSLHGIFESDGFRETFLEGVAERRSKRFVAGDVSFATAREHQIERLADLVEAYLDMGALEAIIEGARPVGLTLQKSEGSRA